MSFEISLVARDANGAVTIFVYNFIALAPSRDLGLTIRARGTAAKDSPSDQTTVCRRLTDETDRRFTELRLITLRQRDGWRKSRDIATWL